VLKLSIDKKITKRKFIVLKHLTQNKKAFTLIEVMVVVGIISILAAIAIPNFLSYRAKSYCTAAETDAGNIAIAIADYYSIQTHTNMIDETDLKIRLTNLNTVVINGNIDAIVITVTDGSGQCPNEYMNRMPSWTSATSTFTKTIP
jgi:type IV pilus assembly protein PilA